MSRKPTSEELLKLLEIPSDTPVGEVYSIPRAARQVELSPSTLYRGIDAKKLKAYRASNLGEKLPILVVLINDVVEFKKTVRTRRKKSPEEYGAVAP